MNFTVLLTKKEITSAKITNCRIDLSPSPRGKCCNVEFSAVFSNNCSYDKKIKILLFVHDIELGNI